MRYALTRRLAGLVLNALRGLFTSFTLTSTMSRSVKTVAFDQDTAAAGASCDGFTRNALTAAGALTLSGLGVTSVMITASVAPAQSVVVAATGGALLYAGDRKANGKSIIPSFGKDEKKSDDKAEPVATEAPAAA